jgi:membrane protein
VPEGEGPAPPDASSVNEDPGPGAVADAFDEPTTTSAPERKAGRMRRWARQGHGWATYERLRVEEALQERRRRSAIVAAGFDIQDLDSHVGGGILAGAVAFRAFLFMVPFVYVTFTVLGLAAKTANEDPGRLAKTVGITGILASAVVNTQDQSAWTQVILVLGATFALLITASSLVKTLYVVHWLVWRLPRVRPVGRRPVVAVIAIAFAMSVLGVVANYVRNRSGFAGAVVAVLILAAASFCLWWWVSWKLPHADASATALVPGAVFIAIGIIVLHLLTTYWIGHLVARKSHTYGAVGIALAVLFWVYILGRIIVGSAGLNATLWLRHQDRVDGSGSRAH